MRLKWKFPSSHPCRVSTSVLLITTIASGLVGAAEEPDPMTKIASEKRGALIVAEIQQGGNQVVATNGCFVGSDGFAVFDLLTYAGPKPPAEFFLVDHTAIDAPTLRYISPVLRIAVVKFNHRPKVWLEPSIEPVEIGLKVAILDHLSEGPVVFGPVMAKVEAVTANVMEPIFEPMFSIGGGLSASRPHPPMVGSVVVDEEGQLRGIFGNARLLGSQTLFNGRPVDDWPQAITKAKATKDPTGHPLPTELNPYDPASNHPDAAQAMLAMSMRRFEEAIRHVQSALKTYPDSLFLHGLQYDIAKMANSGDLLALAEATKPKPGAGAASRMRYFSNLARAKMKIRDGAGAEAAFLEGIAIAPKSAATIRWEYSGLLEAQGKLDEALAFRRAAVEASPENIELLESLQKLLEKLGNWEDSDKLDEKIYELEDLYRRP